MNILILSWRGPHHPHAGGAEIVTHEHAKAWVKAGHQVTLFTSTFTGAKDREVVNGVKIIRQGNQILSVQWKAFTWYLFKNSQPFDLVIDQFHGLPFFTPLFVKARKLAFIHEVTRDVWRYNPLSEPFHSLVSFLGGWGEPWIFKLLYKSMPFLTVSESTKNELVQCGIPAKNITVIHNGALLPFSLRKSPKKAVTFLGAIAKDKGIEEAIKVFSLLKNDVKQFWIIGKYDDKYFRSVNKLASSLGVSKKIKFWGFVSERKKFQLLSESCLVVNPSVREGWGLTVIEAASVGTPTVAYKVSGLQDAIVNKKTGLLAERKTPEKLADLALQLLQNRKLHQQMSQNAVKWSKRFDWKKTTDQSLKLISDLIK